MGDEGKDEGKKRTPAIEADLEDASAEGSDPEEVQEETRWLDAARPKEDPPPMEGRGWTWEDLINDHAYDPYQTLGYDPNGAAPAHGPTPAYALSKAALNAGSRILAAEEAGVWVGAVCPGDVRTRMCVDPEARARAVPADAAVPSVLWLLERAAGLPSGRFWRDREEIQF